ncbi:MAG: nucleotidyl transferase AbiEii/AbiGii toxin family protein [Rhodanobacteraceae bacterium]
MKISFFGSIGFGRVGTPDITDAGVMQVASLDDLMGTKLKVILQRLEGKDYLDIAAMLDAGAALATGLAAAKALFGTAFQPSESLKALTWFEGGDLDTVPDPTRTALSRAAAAMRDVPEVSIASHQLATTTA